MYCVFFVLFILKYKSKYKKVAVLPKCLCSKRCSLYRRYTNFLHFDFRDRGKILEVSLEEIEILVCQPSLCVWSTVKLLNLFCVMFDVSSKPCFINLLAAENNLSPSALVSGFSIFVTGINDMQIAKVLLSLE